jgi:hypothetical protein
MPASHSAVRSEMVRKAFEILLAHPAGLLAKDVV